MEITGKIQSIEQTKEYGEKGFRKRTFILVTDEKYPQTLPIDFVQDKVTLLDKFSVGQEVVVGINLNGREWTSPKGETKYFVSINAWRMDAVDGSATTDSDPSSSSDFEENDDDLPF